MGSTRRSRGGSSLALIIALLPLAFGSTRAADGPALYEQHCATAQDAARTGGVGPALLPESLERLRRSDSLEVFGNSNSNGNSNGNGNASMQMPASRTQLSVDEIAALSAPIYSPVNPALTWSDDDIRASRIQVVDAAKLAAKPLWSADPMNLFVVVEAGDDHVSLVDGDRFKVIHRFASRHALRGEPKFSGDGRFAYFGSRDGWITKYDLWNLTVVAEVRAGLDLRNIAVSADGRWMMAANDLPRTLVLFDSDLAVVRHYDARTRDGKSQSRVAAVYDAAPRKSFVVALMDIPEIWEISYDPKAEPIFDGYVHDYRMGEAIATPGLFGVRRTPLGEPLGDFYFDPSYRHVVGTVRSPDSDGASRAQVVNLDVRRKIAELPLTGLPHPGSGIAFQHDGRLVLALSNLKNGAIDVIDPKSWRLVKTIATPGPGCFLRSHPATPYLWVDSLMSPTAKDTLTIIDKRSLQPVATVREPGHTLAHVAFTHDGRYVLASLWDDDGALIIYDATTFTEVKRLPMRKPVGPYNVGNTVESAKGSTP